MARPFKFFPTAAAFLFAALVLTCVGAAPAHAQLMVNDVIQGSINDPVTDMNYEIEQFNKDAVQLKAEYQRDGMSQAEGQIPAEKRRKWESKLKRLQGRYQEMATGVKRINGVSRALNEAPKAMVDQTLQVLDSKADDALAQNGVYSKAMAGKVKAKGILKDVRVAQGELNKLACPGPAIAKGAAKIFADSANLPKIFFKTVCLPEPPINPQIIMKKITEKALEKFMSPLCFDAEFMNLLPDWPRLPNLSLLAMNPIRGIGLPEIPNLPGFPGIGSLDIGSIPNIPTLPRIPTIKPVGFNIPTLPQMPDFGWSGSLGCVSVTGQAGPGGISASGNATGEVQDVIKDMQKNGELPPPPKQ